MKTYLKILCLGLAILAFSADADPMGPQNNGPNHSQAGSGVIPGQSNNGAHNFDEIPDFKNYGEEVSSTHHNENAQKHFELNSPDTPTVNQVPLPGTFWLVVPGLLALILMSRKFRQRPNL